MPGKADPARGAVRKDWEAAFGSPPPPYLSVAFMRKALAHNAQCRAHGGLPSPLRRALRQIAIGHGVTESTRRIAKPGAQLVREWNGRTYRVEVVEDGYRMDGRTWRSLSAVAGHITGTTWSGPRFFGLTDRAGGRP
ncbi:DUF2924 domain-containing protein [Jannaschia formosa]|uniref:DUF2924 domain-containing protein n=1 Tax=Jannaschia formosa TaxID=2259592 RepID=UPI000E1B599A|nr:DUF2924 domain-containing protein [Jannaschia formosa]TFL16120.1 DUF2924 domain-containing protein [Jannaschia formosa]